MRPALLALLVCVAAAALEGVFAGSRVRARFAELRQPSFSPTLPVWFAIGGVYYVIYFTVLYRLLGAAAPTPGHRTALILVLVLMLVNAVWGWVFFRRKDLRTSFLAFLPYLALAVWLQILLTGLDRIAALVFLPYLLYLPYATWWSYRLWQTNR